ncbi:MAG: hypothetical protein QXN24_05480 [Candidatus Bathyarchaeia archaeon]
MILEKKPCSLKEFIEFWARLYDEGKYPDSIYEAKLNKSGKLQKDNVIPLLEWKNGQPLSKAKRNIAQKVMNNLQKFNDFRALKTISQEDFKKLLFSENVKFDLFPNKEIWYAYLQGKTCRKLTEHDYKIIEANINNPEYLIEKEKVKIAKTKWHGEAKPEKEITTIEPSTHDAIVESLLTIGQIFGYEPLKKPSINDLRPPDKPFKAKEKALDLAWKIFGLTYVPFEVQVHGSIPDLIYRFNLVHPWSLKMVVVAAEEEHHDEITEAAQTYPFAAKLVLITPKEIEKAKKDYKELLKLRQKIFA